MTTLKTLANLLPKIGLSDTTFIYAIIDEELRCSASQAPLGTLQEHLTMLDTLMTIDTLPSVHNIDKKLVDLLITSYMAVTCEILTEPAQEKLEEQIRIIQQLVLLRQQIPLRSRLDYVDSLIRRRLDELDQNLIQDISGTLSEQISTLSSLVDLDAALRQEQWDGDNITGDNIAVQIRKRVDHLRPTVKVKTEELTCTEPVASATKLEIPSQIPQQPAVNSLAALFAERAQRLEAQQREQVFTEVADTRAKARARREAVAADPAKAEQAKYAKEVEQAQKKDKVVRKNIMANIADDRAAVRERTHWEKMARMSQQQSTDGSGDFD